MFNVSITDLPSFDFKRQRMVSQMLSGLPAVAALNVVQEVAFLHSFEKETGLGYDEPAMFRKLIELLRDENHAMERLSRYVEIKSHGGPPAWRGATAEQLEYLQMFSWLGLMVYQKLKREGFYRNGQLGYAVDHMRSTLLILRRLDTIYDLIRAELPDLALGDT